MGSLEKAGVFVVVGLLAAILVIAFIGGQDNGAGLSKNTPVVETPKQKPVVKPTPPKQPTGGGASLVGDELRPRTDSRSTPQNNDRPITPPAPAETSRVSGPREGGTAPKTTPTTTPSSVVSADWPKKDKLREHELIWNLVERNYGKSHTGEIVKLVLAANPTVKPTSVKAGTELTLPAPPAGTTSRKAAKDDAKPAGSRAASRPASKPNGTAGAATPAAGNLPARKKLPWEPD